MKIVATRQIRELDRLAINRFNIPGRTLMERAGRGVAQAVMRLCGEHCLARNVLLAAGKGNNGGDVFVAARRLKERGFDVQVLLAGERSQLRGDALCHFKKMLRRGVAIREIKTEAEWRKFAAAGPHGELTGYPVAVDGILGTGLEGKARGIAAGAIRFINTLAEKSLVVAVDIPSGLNSDTGRAEGEVVRADLTVTMGLPKRGLAEPAALEYVGRLETLDIGFPPALTGKIKAEMELITASDLAPLFRRRARQAHKGSYGHLLIMGGAAGYSGAITLAALAAVRSGAGLVTAVVPERLAPLVAVNVPEAMVYGAPETGCGSLDSACWTKWKKQLNGFSAVLAGPGMTRHAATARLVKLILRDSKIPAALDADALNVFAGRAALLAKRKCPLVITPHPGEMARLLGVNAARVQANRLEIVRKAALATQAAVVLKGAGTLVAARGETTQINLTGNPGMACGGMGDVLAGLLGGLLAQRMKPFDAARAAVFLHGRAGDAAAAKTTERALIARDLIACLPRAFREIGGR